jgi:CRP-like cAMP-binding protein
MLTQKLKKLTILSTFTDQELLELSKISEIVTFAENVVIIRESDKGTSVFGLISGWVEVNVSEAGSHSTQMINRIKEGNIMGEMLLFDRQRRSANVVSRAPLEMVKWEVADLRALFDRQHTIGYKFMRVIAQELADRLYDTNMTLRNFLRSAGDSLI